MNKKKLNITEYCLPAHLTGPLIYGDYSGLDDRSVKELEVFTTNILENHDNGLFILKDPSSRPYLATNNDFNNKVAECLDFLIVESI